LRFQIPQSFNCKPLVATIMTKIADIKSGSIFEIPLAKNLGFAYAKLIFTKDINPDIFENLIVKIYDQYTKEKLINFDKSLFESDKILFFPWLSLGFPPLRGPKKWRLLGYADLTAEDNIIPDYVHLFHDHTTVEEEYNNEYGICYVRDFQNKRIYTKNIDNVTHLGRWCYRDPYSMTHTLTMYYGKKMGLSLKDIYSNEEIEKKNLITNYWNYLTIDTRSIDARPKLIRLRALE
jgi:hypothetical protein